MRADTLGQAPLGAPDRPAGPGASRAYLVLVGTALAWGGHSSVARALADDLSPVALSFWRWLLLVAVVGPLVGRDVWAKRALIRRSWRGILAVAVLGTALYNVLTFWGVRYTTATNLALFNSTIPMWVMLISWPLARMRPNGREITGFLVSLAGVVFIVAGGDVAALGRLPVNVGDLVILLAMMIWGVYTVLLRRRPLALSPLAFLFVTGAIGLAALAPAYAWQLATGSGQFAPTAPVLAGIAYSALIAGLAALLAYNYGVDTIGPARASLFVHLVPVFGSLVAYAFLDERLDVHSAVGFALVVAGLVVANRIPLARRP